MVSDGVVMVRDDSKKQPDFGIEVASSAKTVYSLNAGEVIYTALLGEGNHTVIVKSGGQYFSYSGLAKATVEKGDVVNAGKIIGDLKPMSNDKFILHFSVWDGDANSEKPRYLSYNATKELAGFVGPN